MFSKETSTFVHISISFYLPMDPPTEYKVDTQSVEKEGDGDDAFQAIIDNVDNPEKKDKAKRSNGLYS